jgi:hypothetical protein
MCNAFLASLEREVRDPNWGMDKKKSTKAKKKKKM